jgi:hypothetical protein
MSIKQVTVFEAQDKDIPKEVYDEVRILWRDMEFGNDNYYYNWDSGIDGLDYPIIATYLQSKGVEMCLIHWWW